jgi:hypothetical protein
MLNINAKRIKKKTRIYVNSKSQQFLNESLVCVLPRANWIEKENELIA